MNRSLVVIVVALGLVAGGCYAPAFYADIQENQYAQPGAVTTAGGQVKTGTACFQSYVGIVALGDASVAAALKNAGVDHTKPVKNLVVDRKVFAIGPFYMEICTVVTVTVDGSSAGGAAAAPANSGEPKKSGGEDSFDWKAE